MHTHAPLEAAALAQLFAEARTASGFLDRPVSLEMLRRIYALASWGPTAMNSQPARYVMLTTPEARERLLPHLKEGNRSKVTEAPVCVIVATDTRFYDHLPEVWHDTSARELFAGQPALAQATASRNGTLGGAWFLLAARALGLDCGPMSGFDAEGVNRTIFPDGRWQANFLLNLGYADPAKTHPRQHRLSFDDACRVL